MLKMIPYRTARSLRTRERALNALDPFADDLLRTFWGEGRSMGSMRVDVRDMGDYYLLEADLPGVPRENVRVDVDQGVLSIRAQGGQAKEETDGSYLFRERRCPSMSRSFCLEGIREADICAKFEDGVLALTLPKEAEDSAETKRSIEIR